MMICRCNITRAGTW